MHDPLMFRGKYRIPSTRARRWDYGSMGSYFVTMCTKNRAPWFGDLRNGRICISDIGAVVADEWMKTPIIRPYVSLDQWIIMPDHFHAIVVIAKRFDPPVGAPRFDPRVETPRRGVSTKWQSGCLGAIINQFKSVCTKRIRAMGYIDFAWQPRFHDRIIRDPRHMDRIRRYILANPSAKDKP